MSWISYAQNAEDVRLRRAFAGQPTGFYIDVGANDPVGFSITKHFYENGWSGINVEPLPTKFALLEQDRPRDINLNLGCSDQPGVLKLYAGRGGSSGMSTLSAEEMQYHQRLGFEFDELSCRVVTLASIYETHAAERVIDFLSIDVEGHEREVLEGADFSRFRPRVVVVEATRPNTTEPTHERWQHLLVDHGYTFAVFDGLNRYYVRHEDLQLVPLVALAPNVFDDFVPYVYQRQIDKLRTRLVEATLVNRVSRRVKKLARAATRFGGWVVTRRG
ncbi:MAG TPA: FkbM family methyltransferase [Polyangiaceae bacterium]|nr:FkbM family methyltransferase [Polyangiaceae bacterium]